MSFADAVIRPLHDPESYRRAAEGSRGRVWARSLLHLLRLALLAGLAVTIAATLWLSTLWSERLAPVLDAIPTIIIRGGVARVEGPQPWERRVLRDRAGHDWVVLLDTSGQRRLGEQQRGLLLARTELLVKVGAGRPQALPLSRVRDVKLGPHALRRAILWRLMLAPPALLVLSLGWFALARLGQALLLARWLGSGGAAPAYHARVAVAAQALTAATWMDCAAWLLPLPSVLSWPAWLGLALIYARAGQRQLQATPVAPPAAPTGDGADGADPG